MDRNLTIELTPYQTDRLLNILTSWAIYCEHDAASLLQMKGKQRSRAEHIAEKHLEDIAVAQELVRRIVELLRG